MNPSVPPNPFRSPDGWPSMQLLNNQDKIEGGQQVFSSKLLFDTLPGNAVVAQLELHFAQAEWRRESERREVSLERGQNSGLLNNKYHSNGKHH